MTAAESASISDPQQQSTDLRSCTTSFFPEGNGTTTSTGFRLERNAEIIDKYRLMNMYTLLISFFNT